MLFHIVRWSDIALDGPVYGTIGNRIGNIQNIMVSAKHIIPLLVYSIM